MNWAFPLFLIYTHFTFFSRFFFIAFLSCLPNCLRQFVYLLKNFPFFLLSCDICDISEVCFVLFLFVMGILWFLCPIKFLEEHLMRELFLMLNQQKECCFERFLLKCMNLENLPQQLILCVSFLCILVLYQHFSKSS